MPAPPPIPVEAGGWAGEKGTLWFDSSLAQGQRLSLLCISPVEVLEGRLQGDAAFLDQKITALSQKYPRGGLAGAVTYEGDYRFGVYPEVYKFCLCTNRWMHSPPPGRRPSAAGPPACELRWNNAGDSSDYCRKVREIQEYIAAGDIYQACLTYDLEGVFHGDPWVLFTKLRAISPAPYSAYLDLGVEKILSLSPELFLSMQQKNITTRPIKGTRPRGGENENERPLEEELLSSEKERAELLMITDLERNDLGRVCEIGSVHVPELLRLERYAQVFHLVSTVTGRLRSEVGHASALAACFPGGSITGAPKKRAMEILSELESRPRGFYTGAIGYFGFDSTSCFNIAIRTLCLQGARATYGTGAGIVADSIPEREWEETTFKAMAVRAVSC